MQRLIPEANRLVVIFSDIEMGAGGVVDDFPHSDWLAELFLQYNAPPYDQLPVDLVFNGDTLDLLKTSYQEGYPRHIDQRVATGKLARIAAAHPDFFDGVRRFLEMDGPTRRVFFTIGNHDLELLFPAVQKAIRRLVGDHEHVYFPGFELQIGDIHIEHGNQGDTMFTVDPDEPFVHYDGRKILNLPWGAVALLDVAMPLQPILYHFDRVKPRDKVFELVPEMKELVLNAYWAYWTRDWWTDFFTRGDPVKHLSWTVFREVVYRFNSLDLGLSLTNRMETEMRADQDEVRTWVMGHTHTPALQSYGNRRLLVTGPMRNEYMLEGGGTVQRPLPKVYAEIFLDEGFTRSARLVDVYGPPAPPGHVPASLTDLTPKVQALLGSEADRAHSQAQQRAQEQTEEVARQTHEETALEE